MGAVTKVLRIATTKSRAKLQKEDKINFNVRMEVKVVHQVVNVIFIVINNREVILQEVHRNLTNLVDMIEVEGFEV